MGLWGCTRDDWHHGSCRLFGTMRVAAVAFPVATLAQTAPAQTPLSRSPLPPFAATACRFNTVAEGSVSGVVDGRSFVLTDGREVRLAGLEVPMVLAGQAASPAEAGHASRAKLESILAGATVKLT